jgi:predicted dehydrogenase
VVALLDPDHDAQRRARRWYGEDLRLAADMDDLLRSDLDGVFVLSPDHLHEEHAAALIGAGVATYLEKPLAITIDGCDRLLRLAQAKGTALVVGHTMRRMPFVREMRRLIRGGAIGEPKVAWCRHFVGQGGELYFSDWHADRSKTKGLLLHKGSHDIDVIQWLCEGRTEVVTALGELLFYDKPRPREPVAAAAHAPAPYPDEEGSGAQPAMLPMPGQVADVEDVSLALMRLDNGVLASYQQCHFTPDHWRSYTIIGTDGRIENFGDTGPGAVIMLWNRRRPGYDRQADQCFTIPDTRWEADLTLVDDFLCHLRHGWPTAPLPIEARDAAAAACAATESLRSGGQPVRVPAFDPRGAAA